MIDCLENYEENNFPTIDFDIKYHPEKHIGVKDIKKFEDFENEEFEKIKN